MCAQVYNLWITRINYVLLEDKMKITIVSVGKLKEKYWKQAIAEYEKRLGPYTKIELIEVPDEKAPENMSDKEIEQVKEKKANVYSIRLNPNLQ